MNITHFNDNKISTFSTEGTMQQNKNASTCICLTISDSYKVF